MLKLVYQYSMHLVDMGIYFFKYSVLATYLCISKQFVLQCQKKSQLLGCDLELFWNNKVCTVTRKFVHKDKFGIINFVHYFKPSIKQSVIVNEFCNVVLNLNAIAIRQYSLVCKLYCTDSCNCLIYSSNCVQTLLHEDMNLIMGLKQGNW